MDRTARTGPPPERTAHDLLAWFRDHRRPLPWRAVRDPYRIWVAEVILQQTRVAQAVPLFERFVARFPTIRSLGRARLADVLKAWEGAGYYARARHLHAAAQEVLRGPGGKIPDTVAGLERLSGVGRYISRAVAALAFDRPVVALEANGVRVAARWVLEKGDPRSAKVRGRLEETLSALLPPDSPGAFNEAIMELGETVCVPVAPRCGDCPVSSGCRAYQELPDPGRVPPAQKRSPRPHVRGAVVVVNDPAGRWLLQQRPLRGLLGGLWEFPGGKIEPGESPRHAARRELREETGATVSQLTPAGVVRHAYSHFTVELHVFRGRLVGSRPRPRAGRRWVPPEWVGRLPLPRATEKIVRLLGPSGRAPT